MKAKEVKECIIDIGLKKISKGSRLTAAIKGSVDAGMKIPVSDKIFPNENRIRGKDIENYANLLLKNKEKYEKQFSKCIKENLDLINISKNFEEVKNKILKNEK